MTINQSVPQLIVNIEKSKCHWGQKEDRGLKWESKEGEKWTTTLQKDELERRNKESVQSDGSPPTVLPVVEQIGAAAARSDCRVDQASADRWLPPSLGHRAVHSLPWFEVHAHTTLLTPTSSDWWPMKMERGNGGHGCFDLGEAKYLDCGCCLMTIGQNNHTQSGLYICVQSDNERRDREDKALKFFLVGWVGKPTQILHNQGLNWILH